MGWKLVSPFVQDEIVALERKGCYGCFAKFQTQPGLFPAAAELENIVLVALLKAAILVPSQYLDT